MKTKALLCSLACLLLISCGEDRRKEFAEQTAADRWIEKTMRQHYYWYQDIKKPAKGFNYFTEPVTFFNSLLSSKDGKGGYKYSYIESFKEEITETRSISRTDYSYGFDFETYSISGTTNLMARILYVAKDSPAAEAGLKRGDWILQIGEEGITKDNYALLFGSEATQFIVGAYDIESGDIVAYKTVEIGSARTIVDPPIHYYDIIETNQGKVGYLVYNHFDSNYNQAVNELFAYFKAANLSEFILDLRYNPGGTVDNAQLLSSILAPASALSETLGYLEFNDKTNPQKEELLFMKEVNNLNLQRVYVLTTSQTASASELLMYCLAPYMQIVIVGQQTEGKNVGSSSFANEEQQLVMHPIVCKVYNAENESEYASGIKPTNSVAESSDIVRASLPFGNRNELLLGTALDMIENGYDLEEPETRAVKLTPVYNSIDRKKIPAVLLNRLEITDASDDYE